jgi:hypothetical protein
MEMPVDCRSALPQAEVAPVPLIVDDAFYEYAREHGLPGCSVSFLMLAGSWSARNSRSGFVPSSMLADFSDDPEQAERTLKAAGLLRRVKAGVRIIEGCGLTVVNACDVSRDIEQDKAEAEEQRAAWRVNKQRQRDAKKAGQAARIAAGVPGMSPGTNADVHPESPGKTGKPQVSGDDVPGDIAGTSPGTAKKTASDNQDQDQSPGVGLINAGAGAGAREAPPPGAVAFVVAETAKKAKRIVATAEALRAIAAWDRRAEEAGKVIHDPVRFYGTCVKRERDIEAVLAPPPDPLWTELGTAPDPVPGAHPYERDQRTGVCTQEDCQMPEHHARHQYQGVRTG